MILDVLLGDARIVLERQLAAGRAQAFDVLAIDAFNSDAIPIHLLTLECFQLYWSHLKPDGVLAIHVSNRFIDLPPVVARLAAEVGKEVVFIGNSQDRDLGVYSSDWVLMTANGDFLAASALQEDREEMPAPGPLWTDDYSSLIGVLK